MTVLGTVTASLRVRNFRLFALGQLASATGTWAMVVAQDWLVLRLTGDSPTALAAVTAAQFGPVLLFTLLGGRMADRFDKRLLLAGANLASALLAAALAAAVLSGAVRLGHVVACAVATGLVNAVETPTRLAFVGELVGPRLLPNASALSAAYFTTARILGPAVAGVAIAVWDVAAVMLANAVSYAATVAALLAVRPAELHRPEHRPPRDGVLAGLRHLAGRRDLALPLALLAVVALAGFNFQVTLPLLAKEVFGTGPRTFGLLSAAMAVGSLAAAIATTGRRDRPPQSAVLAAAVAFAALEICSGLAPSFPLALVCLAGTGAAMTAFSQACNHRIQLGTDPAYRGRVMALYTVVFQGTTPFGALLTGRLAEAAGPRSGLWAAGAVCGAAALAACALAARVPRSRPAPAAPAAPAPEADALP
ncbi:MFS transporter [Streptomyces sp. NPDC085946]|uniref:MFS transporter n=1 Tax=Streptomyces sp. NPDC085946 TaxID=3365744 RepID=UPI0037CFE463